MINSNQFNFITWNVGTNSDYTMMEQVFDKHLEKDGDGTWRVSNTAPERSDAHREEVNQFRKQKIKDILQAFSKDVPLFCLQEVERDWEAKEFLPENYSFVKDGDQIVAWKDSEFEPVNVDYEKTTSEEVKGYRTAFMPRTAITALKSRTTGNQILVCSAHITGCNPDTPSEEQALSGNNEVATISRQLKELSENNKIPHVIVGIDANVTRAYQQRLDQLRDNGFKIDERQAGTNFNIPKNEALKTKKTIEEADNPIQKIDYVAVLGGETTNPDDPAFFDDERRSTPLGNLERNPSDHQPLAQRITLATPTRQQGGGFFRRLFGLGTKG